MALVKHFTGTDYCSYACDEVASFPVPSYGDYAFCEAHKVWYAAKMVPSRRTGHYDYPYFWNRTAFLRVPYELRIQVNNGPYDD